MHRYTVHDYTRDVSLSPREDLGAMGFVYGLFTPAWPGVIEEITMEKRKGKLPVSGLLK